ncbi:hypothetical protein RB195_020860 [Necator americanus]|uniref:Uncharacterized protein n=1 Tax=Necator americanus TaxID=51031 RepID=A0ABR1CMI0_NECAM
MVPTRFRSLSPPHRFEHSRLHNSTPLRAVLTLLYVYSGQYNLKPGAVPAARSNRQTLTSSTHLCSPNGGNNGLTTSTTVDSIASSRAQPLAQLHHDSVHWLLIEFMGYLLKQRTKLGKYLARYPWQIRLLEARISSLQYGGDIHSTGL